jgi:hypothetical protein
MHGKRGSKYMRSLFGAVALAAIAVTVVLIGTASAAKPPPPPANSNCPTSTSNLRDALNVGASYDAGTGVYSVERFGPSPQTSLVKYCVYTDKIPTVLTATAHGTDGSAWTASKTAKTFSFSRPGGTPTNLALDGTNQPVGTATFAQQPTRNDIVLHISDAGQCFDIYGVVTPTCFVTPGEEPGLVCDAASSSDTNAAYNSIPKDAVNCGPPSHAFEGTQTKEFGNEVVLGAGGTLATLKVLFNSYACKDHPLWNNGQCTTDPLAFPLGDTFTHPITANIYAANANHTIGALLATTTVTQTIPYRPSADPTCVDGQNNATGQYRNPVTNQCTFSKKVVLSFTFPNAIQPALASGDHVIWTVAYNTTHYGSPAIGEGATCYTSTAGCPYDSLNVGTKTFTGSPYAGTEADTHAAFINSTWNEIYCDNGVGGTNSLRVSTNPPDPCTNTGAVNNYAPNAWEGLTPLATIILS